MTFEQTTSLFALAMADILVINMWTQDVGRHTGSNYGLLKVIFEVNLKLFKQESEKKLLFCLRDFNHHASNFESIKQMIKEDISLIWGEIYKPEGYEDSKAEQFFSFDFQTLPHKEFMPNEFKQECESLKLRFRREDQNSLFPSSIAKNVPLDGFALFIEQTWKSIRSNKELNLPGQKQMVATYRCNELKQESFDLVQDAVFDLIKDCEKNIERNFYDRAMAILKKAHENYSE